jgi:CRISPR-associated protein Cmr5
MQTRDQKLAVKAFRRVESLQREIPQEVERKKYGTMAHKLPVLIRSAGLAQALGFLSAKPSESMNKRLLDDLAFTLGLSSDQLIRQSRGGPNQELGDYLRLTLDALAALLWYKRFAQSILGVEQGSDSGD